MTRATITTSIATDLANNSNILPSELRGVLTAHLNESDLRTENGATIATRADLITATWPTVGQIITTLGHAAVGDGGGADWKIVANGTVATPDGYTTIALTGTTLQAQLLPGPGKTFDLRSVGITASTGGSNNRLALLALWAYASTQGGCRIFGATNIKSHNVIFSPVSEPNTITVEFLKGRKIEPTNPIAGTYVWDFQDPPRYSGATSGVTCVHLINVEINSGWDGDVRPGGVDLTPSELVTLLAQRPACNGIRLGAGNNTRVVDCFAMGLAGTGFRVDRSFNSDLKMTTFGCGDDSATPKPAVLICGASVGGVTNDVCISGASERDLIGWWIEDSVLLRKGSSIKLHGTTYTKHALTLFRCNDFKLDLVCSEDWTVDGFVRIADATNGMGISSLSGYGGSRQTVKGELELRLFHNRSFRRAAASGLGKYIMIDARDGASILTLRGDALQHPTEYTTNPTGFSDYYDLDISSTTNAFIDVEHFNAADVAYNRGMLDNRAAVKRAEKTSASMSRGPQWKEITSALSGGEFNTQRAQYITYTPTATGQVITSINQTFMEIGEVWVRCGNGNTSITASANLRVNGATSGTTALASGTRLRIQRWTENLFCVETVA